MIITLAGAVVLAMAVLPRLTPGWPLSTPLILMAFGLGMFMLPLGLPNLDPGVLGTQVEYLTEFAVLAALMGAGLKIDRRMGWRRWRSTWILLGITMPLTVAGAALLGWWAVGLAPAAALLFGAAMAPTDPVLAGEVQVGPPGQGPEEEGRVGFSLTSEAGLNDGLAFPFVHAAIAMAVAGADGESWLGEWLAMDVAWRIAVGVAGGWLAGKAIGRLLFGPEVGLSRYTDGLVALAATLLTYGLVELVEGYGFLAVFVAAYMIRETEPDHDKHLALHRLIEQVEHLALAAVLVLLAGAIASGALEALTLPGAVVAVLLVLLVRPLAGLPVLAAELPSRGEALAVAFFGIRGIGSLYYLAYATNRADFADEELVWAMAIFTIITSVVVHGLTATAAMRRVQPEVHQARLAEIDGATAEDELRGDM